MDSAYKLSSYIVVTDLIDVDVSPEDPSRILFSTRKGESIKIKDRVFNILKNGSFNLLKRETFFKLVDSMVIVPHGCNEFDEILKSNITKVKETEVLGVTIQPSANCQLDCGYCGQIHSKKSIDHDLGVKISNRIFSKLEEFKYKKLNVQWYGGEPLMAYNELLKISDRLIDYCFVNDVEYSAYIVTNGLSFKPGVFLKLLERKILNYQITLDGIAETHDVMRITKEGHKTFDIILNNIVEVTSLDEYINSDCKITIRMNVDINSSKFIYKLIDKLSALGLCSKRVSLNFAPIFNWGGNGAVSNGLSRDVFAASEIGWIKYAINSGFVFSGVIPKRRNAPCTAVYENNEVYDALGNIYPCYEFPYTKKYDDEKYLVGNLNTVDFNVNNNAITRNWFKDVEVDDYPCRKCNLFPVCGGACPKQWYDNDVACPSFKINIKEKLLIDYDLNR